MLRHVRSKRLALSERQGPKDTNMTVTTKPKVPAAASTEDFRPLTEGELKFVAGGLSYQKITFDVRGKSPKQALRNRAAETRAFSSLPRSSASVLGAFFLI